MPRDYPSRSASHYPCWLPKLPQQSSWGWHLLLLGWLLTGCSSNPDKTVQTVPLGTGHFEGNVALGEGAVKPFKLQLELRYPRVGHYEAEVLAPEQPSLNFVTDTVTYQGAILHLIRPGRPGQRLTLTRQGDFWRGTLALDSAQVPVLLLRRGDPEPATYRVVRPHEAELGEEALLFSPADESTPGPAVAIYADSASAASTPITADALARQGYAVLLLPAADSLTAADVLAATTQLRLTPGVDTANIGVWAMGNRASALAQLWANSVTGPRLKFVVVQGAKVRRELRPAWRALLAQRVPLLVVPAPNSPAGQAAAWRATVRGSRRAKVMRPGTDLTAIVNWLREQ